MFNRLSGLVNSAVEVLAPQIVARDEAFRVHWAYITAFYDRHFGAATPTAAYAAIKGEKKVPITFNIAYHLDLLVKYVKEEEAELGEETGACLQYLLERRILDTLVEYAALDAPAGMRNHVLRAFALFIVNVRARILLEAAVRAPLQKLIRLCHHTLAAERKAPDLEMTEDLVKLVHAVFRKLHGHPELMVLFFGRTAGHGDDAGQTHAKFYIFSVLLDYNMVPGRIGRIAREATILTVQVAALPDTHPTVSEYLAYDSNLCETITERLAMLYAMPPTRPAAPSPDKAGEPPPESPVLRNGWGKSESMTSMESEESSSSSSGRSVTAMLTQSQKALFQFLSFFRFVDDVSAVGDENLTRRLSECFRMSFADLVCGQARAGWTSRSSSSRDT